MTIAEFFYWLRLRFKVWREPKGRACPCGGQITTTPSRDLPGGGFMMGGTSCKSCGFFGLGVMNANEDELRARWERQQQDRRDRENYLQALWLIYDPPPRKGNAE